MTHICTNPKHSHGAGCFRHCRCKCDVCRAYNSNYVAKYARERNMLAGKDVWMPSLPSTLRLRALAWMGWSPQALAGRYGVERKRMEIVRRGTQRAVRRSTHRLIARMFNELWHTRPEGKSASQARAFALKQGWPSPMELDEDQLHGRRKEQSLVD